MYNDVGPYHIATVEQLAELPSSIQYSLKYVTNVLHFKLSKHRPGDTVDCKLWGQKLTMTYDVLLYIVVTSTLESA